ncbi:response regulator transcription factor [Marinilongibacter aquaticus]|uniref:response regulator transcription factor n=1 Tax=Marinilongibacter aquaticus TaxID=2975157 RepID=UPI0021BDAC07|nr:response regulator transcription factor [Marinilongibacter aquaticus]UBM60737.1 response regulator transcription factor [Marinilongibacter aquaticus]
MEPLILQKKEEKSKLLIIDDSIGIQKILTNFLKDEFFLVIKNDGLEGLAWLDEGNEIDLILVDINMPNLDGLELLKIIKSSSFYKHIPVIMLSAESESSKRIASLERGADAFITKPFNPQEVVANVKALLRKTPH